MQSLKKFIDEIFESEIIYEKLNSDFIRGLMDQMKVTSRLSRKANMSQYSTRYYNAFSHIRLDKITDDRIRFYEKEEFPLIEKELKQIIAGKTQSIIIAFDNYNDNIVLYLIDIDGEMFDIQETHTHTSGSGKSLSKPAKLRDIEHHKIAIIDVSGICDREQTRIDRRWAQSGIVENTPEYYAEVARKNISRYKDIIARNRASRDNTKIIDDANKLIERIQKLSNKLFDKSLDGEDWENIDNIYRYLPTFIQLFHKYIGLRRKYNDQMKNGDAANWLISQLQDAEKGVNDLMKDLNQQIKDLGI